MWYDIERAAFGSGAAVGGGRCGGRSRPVGWRRLVTYRVGRVRRCRRRGSAVAVIRAAARARAAAEAALAAAVVGLADLCDDRDHDSLEVAAVMCWTPRFADAEVFWCRS